MIASNDNLSLIISNLGTDKVAELKINAIRIIANLSCSNSDYMVERMVFHGILPKLANLLDDNIGGNEKCECIWALANICANGSA